MSLMFALQREPESRRRWHVLTAGATLGCAVFGATLGWAAQLPPVVRKAPPQVITMRVVQTPKPAPEPELELLTPRPEPPKEITPRPVPQDRSQVLPKPSPLAPPPEAAPEPTPAEPLALGITLSSTTTNGRGPRIAVGDSLMGEPDRVAKTPRPPRRVQTSDSPTISSHGLPSTVTSKSRASVAAKLKRSVKPAYPASAKNLGLEGVVVLAITIDADGRVQKAQVLKGLGGGLDEAAVSAARRTVWQPATLDGRAVSSTRRFNVRFTLKN